MVRRKLPSPQQSPGELAHEFAKSCANFSEILAPLRDATNGYKQSYMADGWSEEAAEAMAVQYHAAMIAPFISQNSWRDQDEE